MSIQDWHEWGDRLTLSIFDHDHLWLHVIVHVVLVVMPALLICVVVWSLGQAIYAKLFNKTDVHVSDSDTSLRSMPRGLFSFISTYSMRNQMVLALGSVMTLPITYASLELPKQIINNAINSNKYSYTGNAATIDQVDYLFVLCGLYLLVLVSNATVKYYLNYYKGSTAEYLVRRMRLYALKYRRKASGNNLIPVIIQEVEPVCGFSGDSVAVPLLHGGTVFTIIVFMTMQNVALGAAALTLLPIQIIVIPRFQRKVNTLVRQRVLTIRELTGNIDRIDNENEFDCNKIIQDDFTRLYELRLRIFRVKYMMKSVNNLIMSLTPFFFYTIGGYLVIEGKLSLGALVASLASYKDLSASIRELFAYYQSLQDARIRYAEIFTFLKTV